MKNIRIIMFFLILFNLNSAYSLDSLAWFNLGVAQYKQKKFDDSKKSFSQAIILKTKLTDAALFYSALAEFNLVQYPAAEALIKKINKSSIFFTKGQELQLAIRTNSDSMLLKSKQAYSEFDYESCLEFIQESYFADHPTGLNISSICQNKLVLERQEYSQAVPSVTQSLPALRSDDSAVSMDMFYYYADLGTGFSNNIFLTNAAPTERAVYQVSGGAEYILRKSYDLGLGINYDYSNVVSLANASNAYINIYSPITFYYDSSDLALLMYLSTAQNNSVATYRKTGASAAYKYGLADFQFELALDVSTKSAVTATYNYVNGSYFYSKFATSYFIDKNKLTGYVSASQNNSGDQPVTGGTLPYANKDTELGALASFWLTKSSRVIFSYSVAKINYLNKHSVNNIFRADEEYRIKLKFENKLNNYLKLYLEAVLTDHKSNYGNNEVINKNYKENLLIFGLFLGN